MVAVVELYEHQGWVSTSCTLMQVSNVPAPNTKGKVQLSQPVGVGGYVGGSLDAVQTAKNPVRVLKVFDTVNLQITI